MSGRWKSLIAGPAERPAAGAAIERHIEVFSALRTGAGAVRQDACSAHESTPHVAFNEYDSMSKINALCVYCGSSPGTDPAFVEAARDFGKILAENGVRLVYGGGSVGLMGARRRCRARARRRGHRHHPGIPDPARAAAAARAQDLIVTRDMHERKRKMFERADALRRAAGRHRHARRAGRADDLGAARPPQEADPDRQHQRLLGPAARRWSSTCGRSSSCRAAMRVDFLVADTVEDILPKLREAAHDVTEAGQDDGGPGRAAVIAQLDP